MKRILSGVGEKSWFEMLAQRIAAGAAATDVEGRIVYINHAAKRLLELPPRALLSRRCAEVAGCRATRSSSNHADACSVAEIGEGYADIVSVYLGCQDAEVDLVASPVFDEQNERLGWLCHLDGAGSKVEDQLEKAKVELVPNVGHELRAPLASHSVSLDTLLDKPREIDRVASRPQGGPKERTRRGQHFLV